MLAQQAARQVLEFAQEKTQGRAGTCMRFDGLHEHRSHLVAEIGAESCRAESQSLGVELPVECRPVSRAETGPLSEESMGSGDLGKKLNKAGASSMTRIQTRPIIALPTSTQRVASDGDTGHPVGHF